MSATAIVTVPIRILLSQPWSDSERVGQVVKSAKHEAKLAIGRLLEGKHDMSQHGEIIVKIIYEERV